MNLMKNGNNNGPSKFVPSKDDVCACVGIFMTHSIEKHIIYLCCDINPFALIVSISTYNVNIKRFQWSTEKLEQFRS